MRVRTFNRIFYKLVLSANILQSDWLSGDPIFKQKKCPISGASKEQELSV